MQQYQNDYMENCWSTLKQIEWIYKNVSSLQKEFDTNNGKKLRVPSKFRWNTVVDFVDDCLNSIYHVREMVRKFSVAEELKKQAAPDSYTRPKYGNELLFDIRIMYLFAAELIIEPVIKGLNYLQGDYARAGDVAALYFYFYGIRKSTKVFCFKFNC